MEKLLLDAKKARSFVAGYSDWGCYTLFGFAQSYKKNIAFDKNKFSVQAYGGSSDYFYGYIVASFAIGLLDFNFKDAILTPTYFDPVLSEQLELFLQEKALTNTKVKEKLEKIQQYFLKLSFSAQCH